MVDEEITRKKESHAKLEGDQVIMSSSMEERMPVKVAKEQITAIERQLESLQKQISQTGRQTAISKLELKNLKIPQKEIDRFRNVQKAVQHADQMKATETQMENLMSEVKRLADLARELREVTGNGKSE